MSKKISQLNELSAPVEDNLLAIVDSAETKKIKIQNLLAFMYPVGVIYTSIISTNPADLFGFGTWSAFGAGKVLVGYDSSDGNFDLAEETGGEKEHTLSTDEMPEHTHTQNSHNHTQDSHNHTQNSHNHTQDSHNHTQDAHNHDFYNTTTSSTGINGITTGFSDNAKNQTSTNSIGSKTATNQATTATNQATTATNQATTATNQATTATNQNTGGGSAHNNLQPYIVVYMFKRTD